MRFASGKVVGGRVQFMRNLPEGTSAAVLALESDGTFEADGHRGNAPGSNRPCDAGRTTPMTDLLSELRSRE